MTIVTIAEANNSEGKGMRFEYAPTRSWQSFSIRGTPSRLASMEGKALSLAKAVEIWNVSVHRRADALQTGVVSASIRKLIDEARNARAAANKTIPAPLF